MAQTNKKGIHLGVNLDDTDSARLLTLEQKKRTDGLQEAEKEELKQLYEKGRRPI